MEQAIAVDPNAEALPKAFRVFGWVLAILPFVVLPGIRDPHSDAQLGLLLFSLLGVMALAIPYIIASVVWDVTSLVLWARAKRHHRSMGPKGLLALVVVITSQVGTVAYIASQS